MKKVCIALLGFGTVGFGAYKIVTQRSDDIMHKEELDIQVKKVLVRLGGSGQNMNLAPAEIFTTSLADILADEEISIVCECMGGVSPALEYIVACLEAGKTVVTSNKEVLAKHWPELEAAAKSTGAGLYFEATACGGIPVIRTLLDSMQANNIDFLFGIVNGTTNYIMTKMTEEGARYDQALAEAQALGFAEADPTNDVEGWDSVYKLSILASIAFHARVEIDSIYREGITRLTAEDIAVAKEMGYIIKLLAIGKKVGGRDGALQVRVHPTMIPISHPLANVRNSFNGIFLHGDAVDDVMLYGRGAGQLPTASAVISDVICAAKADKHAYMTFNNTYNAPQTLSLQKDWMSGYSVRLTVKDHTGVLLQLASVFAENQVSIHTMRQWGSKSESGETAIVFITHIAKELSVRNAVNKLKTMDCVMSVDSLMRVER